VKLSNIEVIFWAGSSPGHKTEDSSSAFLFRRMPAIMYYVYCISNLSCDKLRGWGFEPVTTLTILLKKRKLFGNAIWRQLYERSKNAASRLCPSRLILLNHFRINELEIATVTPQRCKLYVA
jgi:hypothetical protein